MAESADVLLTLPEDRRSAFKEPLGELFTDATRLLDRAGEPLVTVGDVVTHHVVAADGRPRLAIVDGQTKRGPISERVASSIVEVDWHRETAVNPAGTVCASAVRAIDRALRPEEEKEAAATEVKPTLLEIDGEEDLLAIIAVLAVPDEGAVVYGQPDEGMVLVSVDETARRRASSLVDLLEGDHDRLERLLVEGRESRENAIE